MKIILFLLLFHVYVNAESIKNRAVNLALETVLEFDKKDRASDIKFIDDVQSFLNKVKHVLKSKPNQPSRRALITIPLSFTGFLENIVAILQSYDDDELRKIIKLVQNEIKRNNYQGCKFYELLEENDVREMFNKTLEGLDVYPIPELRRRMDEIITELHDRKLSKDHQEIVDYINSLYKPDQPRKLLDVLNNLQVYQKNTKRSLHDLTRIVRHGIRNVIFNHYSQLQPDVRRGLKIRLEYIAKNALRQVIDHRIYDVSNNAKPSLSLLFVTPVTVKPSIQTTLAAYSIIYYAKRDRTTRVSSTENSAEFIHVYPKESEHPNKTPMKDLLRTIWEEKWTTEGNKNEVEENDVSYDSKQGYIEELVVNVTTPKTTTKTNKRIKKKLVSFGKRKKLKSKNKPVDKSAEPSVATTKKNHKKHHKKTTTTKTSETTSTVKTKTRHKNKKVLKYVEDTATTESITKKHKKHHKKGKISSKVPALEARLNEIYNKTLNINKPKWQKDFDLRYRSQGTTTSLPQIDKLRIYDFSTEVKSSENEVVKPHKKKLQHIVLGMPISNDRYRSKASTKRKVWTYTNDKKKLQKKLERNIYKEHIKHGKNSLSKKKKPAIVTIKTSKGKKIHNLKSKHKEAKHKHRPAARQGRFRVSSDEDDLVTKSSCDDSVEDSTTFLHYTVSDEGLSIESFDDRARKLFVGRRAQNTTNTNKPDSESVLKRIHVLEKELRDVKHIILDKESTQSLDNETELTETLEEFEITSNEYENSSEVNATNSVNSTDTNIFINVTTTTKALLRKGFEVVNTTVNDINTQTDAVNETQITTKSTAKTTTKLTTKSTTKSTTKPSTKLTTRSTTNTIKHEKFTVRNVLANTTKMFKDNFVEQTTVLEKIFEDDSVGQTTDINVANKTLSIDHLIENYISKEESKKATKNKVYNVKNVTTTEMARTITNVTTSPANFTTKVVLSTTNRLNASNIMILNATQNENVDDIIKRRLDFYYEDNTMKTNNNYDDLLLDDLREDGAQ